MPYIFIIANCISWACYAFVTQDIYVFIPNTLGLMVGSYLFLVSYGLIRDQAQRDKMITVAMPLVFVMLMVAAIERLYLGDSPATFSERKQLWGYTGARLKHANLWRRNAALSTC